jgi:hypothetical protein
VSVEADVQALLLGTGEGHASTHDRVMTLQDVVRRKRARQCLQGLERS